ncbi:MAG: peptide chain release factor 2, partial [Ferruginibacter sp.]|nr:peptide chain release factor 2 [Ferruginibacter sp.]
MFWSWGGFFDVANREAKTANDKQLSLSPGFWDDNARATAILKDIKVNEYWMNLYHAVHTAVEDFAVLFEFWKAGEATEEEVKAAYDEAIS